MYLNEPSRIGFETIFVKEKSSENGPSKTEHTSLSRKRLSRSYSNKKADVAVSSFFSGVWRKRATTAVKVFNILEVEEEEDNCKEILFLVALENGTLIKLKSAKDLLNEF